MSDMDAVERDRVDYVGFSDQPRFGGTTRDIFMSAYRWVRDSAESEPAYASDNRKRDKWLQRYISKDPILMGVLSSVVDIDKNRGWRLVGGRNQVGRFTRILHNWQSAPGVFGWRPGISHASRSFWNTDMGSVVEVGRATKNGPIRAFYAVDPASCVLTGDERYPLEYYAKDYGKPVKWRSQDYVRTTSLIDTGDSMNGMGYCAISRCLEFAKLMIAIYDHDHEQLGSKAPRGLLLLNGIGQAQWQNAMEVRATTMAADHVDYFDAVAVLASKGSAIDAKLLALSSLPAGFNLKEWVDMIIYGYALAFGFDASEFWPVQFGALGRGTETEVQHEKASAKGRLDFVLGLQEQLQEFLPETLLFLFDQRDDKGDLLRAQVKQAQALVIKTMYEAGATSAEGNLINRPEARALAAEIGLMPRSWTDLSDGAATDKEAMEGEIAAEDIDHEMAKDKESEPAPVAEPTDDDMEQPMPPNGKVKPPSRGIRLLRDELMNSSSVVRAAERFPQEPIVVYEWPIDVTIQVWESGEDLLRRRTWAIYQ